VLQVPPKLTDGDIAKEILLVNTFKGVQEIANIRPHAFNRVAVDLTKAIAIVVAGILFSTMTSSVSSSICSSAVSCPCLSNAIN